MKANLRRPLSLMLAMVFALSLLPALSLSAFAAVVKETNASGDVFLRNDAGGSQHLQLGITKDGNFGSVGAAPAPFTSAKGGRIGMYMEGDVTTDFFLPGFIDESFTIGWNGNKTATGSLGSSIGSAGIAASSTVVVRGADALPAALKSLYESAAAQALTSGSLANGLKYYQLVTLRDGEKFFHTNVLLENATGGGLTDVRYMRAFDPDHRSHNINYATNNVVGHPELTGYGTSVFAYGANDQKTSPFFFFSNWNKDNTAAPCVQAGFTTAGLGFTNIYGGESTMVFTAGRALYQDTDILILFKLGNLADGAFITFDWYSSMDSNVTSAIENILKAAGAGDVAVDMTGTTMTVTDTKAGFKYALVDGKGDIITSGVTLPEGAAGGWVTGTDGGTLTWTGLSPATDYKVLVMNDTSEADAKAALASNSIIVPTAPDTRYVLYKQNTESSAWEPVSIPSGAVGYSVTGYGGAAESTDVGHYYHSLESTSPGYLEFKLPDAPSGYKVVAITGEGTETPTDITDSITEPDGTSSGATGITINAEAGKAYKLITSTDSGDNWADAGVLGETGVAVLDGSGNPLAPAYDRWFTNPDGTISFVPLSPTSTTLYKVVEIPFGEKTLISPPSTTTDSGSSALDGVTSGARADDSTDSNKDAITITTESGYEYAIFSKGEDGKPGVALTKWESGDENNDLTFPGLDPTQSYFVAARSKTIDPDTTAFPAFSTELKPMPKIPSDSLKLVNGTDGKPYLNILSPIDGVYYHVEKDADGSSVPTTTAGVTEEPGTDFVKTTGDTLTYGSLTAGTYTVTAKSTGENPVTVEKKVEVLAPPVIDPSTLTRAYASDTTDTLTIHTEDGVSYALADEFGVAINAPGGATLGGGSSDRSTLWFAGATGEALVFSGLDPAKKYTVLTKDSSAPTGGVDVNLPLTGKTPIPTIPVVMGGTTAPNATVKVAVVKEDGTAAVLTTTADGSGTYTFNTDGVKHGTYSVFVDSTGGDGKSAPYNTRSGPTPAIPPSGNAADSTFGGAITVAVPYFDGAGWHPAGSPGANWTSGANGYAFTVINKATGTALTAGTDYTITGNTEAGGYVVEGLDPGDYIIQASRSSLGSYPSNFPVSGMTEIHVANGKVTPAGGYKTTSISLNYGSILSGSVTNATPGETVTVQLTVPVYDTASNGTLALIGTKVVTAVAGPADSTGSAYYSIAGVPNGTYAVTAYAADGREGSANVAVSGATTANLPLKDKATAQNTIVGAVLDSDGKGVNGATVTLYKPDGTVAGTTASKDGGGYSVDNLPDGTYYVAATTTGSSGVTQAIEVRGGKVVTGLAENITLTAGNLVIGKVTDSGTAVSGAVVSASGINEGPVTTNGAGFYFLPGVESGSTVTAVAKNGHTATGTSSGANPNTLNLALAAPTTGILVIGPDGKPLTGAAVTGGSIAGSVITPTGGPITITKGGMSYTITNPTNGSTVFIPGYTVSGVVKYEETGLIPAKATVTISDADSNNWGSSTVAIIDGKYSIPNVPAGTYTITVTAADPDHGADVVVTQSVTVASGNKTQNISIAATTAIDAIRDAIEGDLRDLSNKSLADLEQDLQALRNLTAEQAKQINVSDLTNRLIAAIDDKMTDLNSDLSKRAKVDGDSITGTAAKSVETSLANMINALLDSKDVAAIGASAGSGDSVLVLLHMSVNNVEPGNGGVAKALAFAPVTDVAAMWDIVVEKTTTVTNGTTLVSSDTATVHNLTTPVQLTLNIPTEYQGYSYYALITVHNGIAKRVPISVASDTKTLTFQSKDFSVFTLLYSDSPIYAGDLPVTRSSGDRDVAVLDNGKAKISKTTGGSVAVSPDTFKKGTLVTITVKPDEGYELNSLSVTDANGKAMELTKVKENTYTFRAPEGDVSVAASFRRVLADPADTGVSKLLNTDDHIKFLNGDTLGYFNPNYNMTRAEAAQMFFNLLRDQNVTLTASFQDVSEDAWYSKAVCTLASLGIIKGYSDGTFQPENSITRAEFVTIAMHFAKSTTGNVKFTDLSSDHWAYGNIQSAYANGWINGYDDGSFHPDSTITRAEVATIANNMLGRIPDKAYIDANAATLKRFPDVTSGFWGYYTIVEASNTHSHTKDGSLETWTGK